MMFDSDFNLFLIRFNLLLTHSSPQSDHWYKHWNPAVAYYNYSFIFAFNQQIIGF